MREDFTKKLPDHLFKACYQCPKSPGSVHAYIRASWFLKKKSLKLPIFTLDFPCVTLTKRSNLVWDSGGAVWTPHDAHVGCEKLQVKQKMANFKLEKMTPWGLFFCTVTLTKRSVYFKISFSTVKQLPVTQIGGEKQEKASKNLDYFVYKSSSLSRSIQTLWNK